MGHTVGNGGYEDLDPSEAILSLRDPDGVPHVTLYLQETRIFQAMTIDDGEVPIRYRAAVDHAAAAVGARLLLQNDPARALADGEHSRNGHVAHIQRGVLHRENGPALERAGGALEWYREGKFHRDDGPAIQEARGSKWYRDGQLSREDGPAIEWADGSTEWYLGGARHREGGPALELPDGARWWFVHGRLHREGGPAIERADGEREWYLDGQEASPDEVMQRQYGPRQQFA
jgi:hypothetical protein